MKKISLILSLMGHFLVVAVMCLPASLTVLAQEPSCAPGPGPNGTGPRCAPNTVPCAHCTGTWTDSTGAVWTVTSNNTPPYIGTWNVSGSVVAPVQGGCPSVKYTTVSGAISQVSGTSTAATTSIQWTATNPNPPNPCHVSSFTIDANILNDSCDALSGTYKSSNGNSGPISATKQADMPDGNPAETTTVTAWWSEYPTITLYEETIGSSKYMAGRQVYEVAGTPNDTCWFLGSQHDHADLIGGGWFVGFYYFNNKYEYDYVGFLPDTVKYYRDQRKVPCLATIPQTMRLYTNLGSQAYFNDTLYWNIPDNVNYGNAKNGVQAWRTWP